MKANTLTPTQTRGLAQAFNASIKRIVRRANRPTKRERQIHATAKRLSMRVIAIGKTTVAMATDEVLRAGRPETECFQILLYRIDEGYLARGAFTPGVCIAKLDRQDLDNDTFEALGKALVK